MSRSGVRGAWHSTGARRRRRALVLGLARVYAQLEVGRSPIRTLTRMVAKAKRAQGKAAGKGTTQGGRRPPAGFPGAGPGRDRDID